MSRQQPRQKQIRSYSPGPAAVPPVASLEEAAVSPPSSETANPPGSGGPSGNLLAESLFGDAGLAPETVTEIRMLYPRLLNLLSAFGPAGEPSVAPRLRVKAAEDGFRRAGVAHFREGSDFDLDHFTGAQIEAMLNEPRLSVELV